MSQVPASTGLTAWLQEAGFHRSGSILVAVGGLLVLVADRVLSWFRSGTGFFAGAGNHSTFAQLHQLLERTARDASRAGIAQHVSFGISRSYFGWLGWLLLASAVGFGVLAVSPIGRRHFLLRWLSAVIAAAGVGLTVLALHLITFEGNAPNNADAPAYGDYLARSGLGAWCAILGFLLVLIGSLVSGAER